MDLDRFKDRKEKNITSRSNAVIIGPVPFCVLCKGLMPASNMGHSAHSCPVNYHGSLRLKENICIECVKDLEI